MHKTLVVVDQPVSCNDTFENPLPEFITFDDYLRDYPRKNEPKTRIINLCDTERYLSKGYYCSLLAEARSHEVLPSVKTINTLRESDHTGASLVSRLKGHDLRALKNDTTLLICFGQVQDDALQKIAKHIFKLFAAPILKLSVESKGANVELRLERLPYSALSGEELAFLFQSLQTFTRNVWRVNSQKKRYRWDMAILINPQEAAPPSNKEAITRFIKAASKLGIYAEALSHEEIQNISHYDALFIRETTAIDHHTYRLAIRAETHGVLVIDDPNSILRCCNKVYLQDAFSYRGVPAPRTRVVSSFEGETLDQVEQDFSYPLVLKMPEGSFSRGVFKVANREELAVRLQGLLRESALVIVQEYLYTDFDWRIGVLNGRAIYASKYFMARNHWQIYNHGSKRFSSGGFETLPTFEVPKTVLNAALKASSIIGNGLYGVDVKHVDGKAFVLEVNDNPSIEHRVEDAYLGDELYMQIMAEFHKRLEARGR